MDQEKIGALIASLRKKQGLTQSQLGAKVGVGDRAVSKWERGITCPDISIINELSSILGITSDELLKGELTKEHKEQLKEHKFNKKLLLLIPLVLIIIAVVIIISNKNKTYVYTLKSSNNEYEVYGTIIFKNKQTSIIINNIIFKEKEFNDTFIKNFEYRLSSNNILILRYGYINQNDLIFEPVSIKNYMESFSINYDISIPLNKKKVIKNGIILELKFLDVNNSEIIKEVNIEI